MFKHKTTQELCIEQLQSIQKQYEADLNYIAMMCDVELETEEAQEEQINE